MWDLQYSTKADIYSLGIVMWEIVTQVPPLHCLACCGPAPLHLCGTIAHSCIVLSTKATDQLPHHTAGSASSQLHGVRHLLKAEY